MGTSKRAVRLRRRAKELRRYKRGCRAFREWGVPAALWAKLSPAEVRVAVTDEDVAQSPLGHPALCPVCSALWRAGYRNVRLWEDGVAFSSSTKYAFDVTVRLTLPAAVRQFVIDLDAGRPVVLPFEFVVPVRPDVKWYTSPEGKVWRDEDPGDAEVPF